MEKPTRVDELQDALDLLQEEVNCAVVAFERKGLGLTVTSMIYKSRLYLAVDWVEAKPKGIQKGSPHDGTGVP